MDGPRFASRARQGRPSPFTLTRRQALGGMAAGVMAAAGASGGLLVPRSAGATPIQPRLTNPCSRVLLPGEAGLHDYGLDFSLSGPPAVFFNSGDTPGWSEDVKGSVGGFVFGYAATLSEQPDASGRCVQVCVHHGFPSENDADIAWSSLIAALAKSGRGEEGAQVDSLDIVELIVVEGESILATVAGGSLDAVVLASRSGEDLVTVAIADFAGNHPSADEALSLAEAEGEKLRRSREIERTDLRSAFDAQWTPGFQLGSASGAPFFAWPTFLDNSAVAMTGESRGQLEMRRQTNALVAHQSHIEGPFWETNPAFPTHALYYSGQSNFFDRSSHVRDYHSETKSRLESGLTNAAIAEIHSGKTERRYAYEAQTGYGGLSAVTLHYIVEEGDFPLSLSLHIVAVPYDPSSPSLDLSIVIDRLDPVIRQMREGLKGCLVAPKHAPLVVSVDMTV